MHSRRNHGWIALAAVGPTSAIVGAGCSRETPPPFPDHLGAYLSESPNKGFDLYVEAARSAEEDAGNLISRVSWTPDKKRAAIDAAARAIATIARAESAEFEFVYSPTSPLTPSGDRRGWRFIGHALVWRIDEAVRAKNYDAAVADFDRLVRFGTNLTGGDAIDANLGFAMIREARDVLWLAFPMMSGEQLRKVHGSVVRATGDAPPPQVTIRHEKAAMLKAVESVQDAFLAGDLQPFREALGEATGPAFDYLDELKRKPVAVQVAYFERFAREAGDEARAVNQDAAISPHLWETPKSRSGERPWFRLANHYFRNARLFLRDWADHQAWMRLMAVDAALLARLKDKAALPPDLFSLQDWVRTDPYSGLDFVYVPQGTDYRLYGVGPDRKDDFGAAKVDMSGPWK